MTKNELYAENIMCTPALSVTHSALQLQYAACGAKK